MKKLWLMFLLHTMLLPMSLADSLTPLQQAYQQSLSLRFKHDQLQNIAHSFQKELHSSQQQLIRTERLIALEKQSQPTGLVAYTLPFQLIPPNVWQQAALSYANHITVTKIQRNQRMEVIFNFPPFDKNISNAFARYRLTPPAIKVTSVLLSSGQSIEINRRISTNVGEQSLSIPTGDATILKINLVMDYQVPKEVRTFTLTKLDATQNGVRWMPSATHIVVLELTESLAEDIIHVDGKNREGKTLAADQNDRIYNPNEVAILQARIALYTQMLTAIREQHIHTNQEALDYLVMHAENLLTLQDDPRRELVRVFTSPVSEVIIYQVGDALDLQHLFAIY